MTLIKHQCICSDCGYTFFLEDAKWCIHYKTTGIGTKECPQCHSCICHGETAEQIQDHFKDNIVKGKFILAKPNVFGWTYMCKTVKEVVIEKWKPIVIKTEFKNNQKCGYCQEEGTSFKIRFELVEESFCSEYCSQQYTSQYFKKQKGDLIL